ncbi:MAG: hypothetical protein FWG18_03940, partial [Alphaproteobacteria bacterium]|nr:hypothetical protein [Alphaproteobacteria bacterium]
MTYVKPHDEKSAVAFVSDTNVGNIAWLNTEISKNNPHLDDINAYRALLARAEQMGHAEFAKTIISYIKKFGYWRNETWAVINRNPELFRPVIQHLLKNYNVEQIMDSVLNLGLLNQCLAKIIMEYKFNKNELEQAPALKQKLDALRSYANDNHFGNAPADKPWTKLMMLDLVERALRDFDSIDFEKLHIEMKKSNKLLNDDEVREKMIDSEVYETMFRRAIESEKPKQWVQFIDTHDKIYDTSWMRNFFWINKNPELLKQALKRRISGTYGGKTALDILISMGEELNPQTYKVVSKFRGLGREEKKKLEDARRT